MTPANTSLSIVPAPKREEKRKRPGSVFRSRPDAPVGIAAFTLVEVVVALVILQAGILAGVSLLASARQRTLRAEASWREQHLMAQAMEYFLLAGADNGIPEEFFPYPDYSVDAATASPQGLPPEVADSQPGWRLETLTVMLHDNHGNVVRQLSVDRIVREEP
ncbi:MAG: hypothetical protein PHQ27_06150 [Victivallales bacterium]|nr:hypothetical protein [Victivallales bacterium]